jgi:hypothetical protein
MYYKLKCSPLTTWDQYNCGEWDYLTYTRVFDHTGQFDSVATNGMQFLANFAESFIDMRSYPSGTYLFQIETGNGTYSQKYIRQ